MPGQLCYTIPLDAPAPAPPPVRAGGILEWTAGRDCPLCGAPVQACLVSVFALGWGLMVATHFRCLSAACAFVAEVPHFQGAAN